MQISFKRNSFIATDYEYGSEKELLNNLSVTGIYCGLTVAERCVLGTVINNVTYRSISYWNG